MGYPSSVLACVFQKMSVGESFSSFESRYWNYYAWEKNFEAMSFYISPMTILFKFPVEVQTQIKEHWENVMFGESSWFEFSSDVP